MSNISVGIIKDATEAEVKRLKAVKLADNVHGFQYIWSTRPSEDILNRCIENQDIEREPLIEGSWIALYVKREFDDYIWE